ncbi:sugar phosphate isomerase/epimerase [Xylanibacillus composti]|uniref:Xylose isomerase-like TIM barrel domain-containing protein n=1 Tax=Xylanibacillus composti TaxID=1572762 RepID=A0A8J4M2X0_9BACL|nr:TIM barrel protein [Xylanibacillus composti]MDT9726959.1 sugar phosphate isomerase/epimerase [Xylanibacillus composti]GIQ69515.1 hypothetical protein XYCOK13_23390 [Xylanibacillus composti]
MLDNRLALSSWSLHRLLGPLRWTVWDEASRSQTTAVQLQPQEIELLELPKVVKARGFQYLELCHFHFPSTEEEYLSQLKQAFADAEVRFHTLLVDYGDISSPEEERRRSDMAYLRQWLDIAAKAGADAVRIVAGEQEAGDLEAMERSREALTDLRAYGQARGVMVVTENFRELTATVGSWRELLESIEPRVSTIVDFGNLLPSEREAGIAYGTPHAHSIHAKPLYREDGSIDKEDFERMLAVVTELNDSVPITVIFDQEGDMWEGITEIQACMQAFGKGDRG